MADYDAFRYIKCQSVVEACNQFLCFCVHRLALTEKKSKYSMIYPVKSTSNYCCYCRVIA
jgi:hypothetical protein